LKYSRAVKYSDATRTISSRTPRDAERALVPATCRAIDAMTEDYMGTPSPSGYISLVLEGNPADYDPTETVPDEDSGCSARVQGAAGVMFWFRWNRLAGS
jgi:hypothetical protein